MTFYMFLCIILLIILLPSKQKGVWRKASIILTTIILLGVYGLRNVNVGIGDVVNVYLPEYNWVVMKLNYFQILNRFKDPAFYIMTKFIINISNNNVNFWLFVCAALYIIPLMKLIDNESSNPLISVFMFLAFDFFGTAFSGLRHCIACGILFFSFKYLKDEKFLPFLIVVIIASCFHITALLFLLAYPVINVIKWKEYSSNKIFMLNVIVLCLLVFNKIMGNYILKSIFDIVINVFNLSRFSIYTAENYSSLNSNLFIIHYAFFLFSSLLYKNNIIKPNSNEDIFYKLQFIGVILLTFVGTLGEFYRLSYFFISYSIFLIPSAINMFRYGNTRKAVSLLILAMCFVYFLFFGIYNNVLVPYRFFWR